MYLMGLYTSMIRPLISEEREALIAKAENPVTLTSALLVAALCSAISISVLYVVDHYLGFFSLYFPVLFSIIIVAWLVYSIRSYLKLYRSFSLTPYEDDLAGGIAEVTRFHATKAIRVEELDDQGGGYFLYLKDGRSIFLRGQYLFDLEENEKFPCSEFEVSRGPNSGAILNLVCCGSYFPSRKIIASFRQLDLKAVPTDGDIIAVPWEKIDRMPT
jgi:hypothetical protein